MNALAVLIVRGSVYALLVTAMRAQYYWPAGSASTVGNAVMNAPFTAQPGHATTSTRCMVVIDPSSLPFPIGTAIHQISLRRDVLYPNQPYGSFSGTLSMRIGRAVAVPDQIQDVRFSRLWQGVPATVHKPSAQTPFVVPAAGAPGSSVPSFSVVIPFLQPFTWLGGPLAIDMVWTPSSGSSAWRVDAFAVNRPQNGTGRPAGLGCVGSNGFSPFHYALPETTMPGAILTVQMERAKLPANPGSLENLAFHLVGLQNVSYQSQPLPMPLSAVGGPPGCFLRVDPLLSFTVFVTNPSTLFARATGYVSLPPHPALVGAVLYSQWLCPDTGFSVPLPIIASDAQAITLGGILPPPASRTARTIWKYGATGFDNESGRMMPDDYGPILRFN